MQTILYFNESLIEKIGTSVIIFPGHAMIIGPMWWLQHLADRDPDLSSRLWVITRFFMLAFMAMNISTHNKPLECLAAIAAYVAVLMVFMQVPEGHS